MLVLTTMLTSGMLAVWSVVVYRPVQLHHVPQHLHARDREAWVRSPARASSLLVMAIVGGAIIPLLQGVLADPIGMHHAFILPAAVLSATSCSTASRARDWIGEVEKHSDGSAAMASVVCFGEALIDFLAEPVQTTRAPQPSLRYAGGAPANVAVAVARLGTPSAFVGMLGRDMFGDFLLESWQTPAYHTAYVVRTDEANTALAFVSLDDTGERRFSFYRPAVGGSAVPPAAFRCRVLHRRGVFHACSNSLTEADIADTTLEGMRRAHAAGALVSFDMNLRPNLWPTDVDPRPRIWQALHEADLVKLCASGAGLPGRTSGRREAVLAELWRGRTQWLLVTDGAAPLGYFTRVRAGQLAGIPTCRR